MVQHLTSLDGVNIQDTWLTIGSFDGVHIGHQYLIRELTHSAHPNGGRSVVLTFHPHPAVILRGRTGAFYLTTVAEKADLLDHLGIDVLITHPFTYQISQSSASEFLSYLKDHLGFKQLWVGADFALGRGREGNIAYLKQHQTKFGYELHTVDPVSMDGQVVSSSIIRTMVSAGNVEIAGNFLGRLYRLSGEVVHGDGRGKGIGIPTANLDTGAEKLIPGAGVYACRAFIDGESWPAAVNIGTRPTFESSDPRSHVEAHILGFSKDLYTQVISLEFISRLRGEERFETVDELLIQVQKDIAQTREIVSG